MFQQLLCQRADKAVIDDAENRRYRISRDRPFTGSGALVEQADCIAHTAISLAGNQRCGVSRDLDLFLLGDVKQMFFDLLIADAAEIKALAARENSHRQLMRRCGGEDKNHMSRRLLQGFEDSIESVIGQHMHFVDDIDLIAFLGRSVFDPLAQITDLIDAAVGSAVDLDDIHALAMQ